MRDKHFIAAVLFTVSLLILMLNLPLLAVQSTDEAIWVVATIPPIAEFIRNVGGERVHVIVMVPSGFSPHTYEPKPKQLIEASKAKIYFQVGSGIEFENTWTGRILGVNSGIVMINCSEGIRVFDGDPHVWLSPKNAKIIVYNIYCALSRIDPENEPYYRHNMESYINKLDDLNGEIEKILSKVKNRYFMVYHPSWGYFARAYNLTQISLENEGREPTVSRIAMLIRTAKELNIKIIITSPQSNIKDVEVIAEAINGRVKLVDPLSEDYVSSLLNLALSIRGDDTRYG